ncbi:uncharacterized protein TrAFT101_009181 [Trichoderma asperellum]|uniref:uncharacterized protein n=1 Tax=Trichoderma asperellum TaxID=101201 RepID=UPI0033176CD5|nr:hypothetical protein TrAFT101_009181 [Trichoderma asperellum]
MLPTGLHVGSNPGMLARRGEKFCSVSPPRAMTDTSAAGLGSLVRSLVGALDLRQKGSSHGKLFIIPTAGLVPWSLHSLETDLLSCWSIHMTYQLSGELEGVARSVE